MDKFSITFRYAEGDGSGPARERSYEAVGKDPELIAQRLGDGLAEVLSQFKLAPAALRRAADILEGASTSKHEPELKGWK